MNSSSQLKFSWAKVHFFSDMTKRLFLLNEGISTVFFAGYVCSVYRNVFRTKKFQLMSHFFKKRKNMKNCKIKKVVKMIFFKNSITLVMFKNLFKSFRRGKTSQMCPKCHFHISAVLCRSISYVQHLSTTC